MAIIRKFFVWILLYFIFLEIFLRLGGQVSVWKERIKNFNSRGDYKIICIGDSVTGYGSYPEDLQKILNSRQNKIHFVVFNLGRPGAGFNFFIENLPAYLDQYKPNMVVSMLGLAGKKPEDLQPTNKVPFDELWKQSTVLRMIQFLGGQLLDKASSLKENIFHTPTTSSQPSGTNNATIDSYINAKAIEVVQNPTSENYTKLGLFCRAAYKNELSLQYFLKAVEISPNNYLAWHLIVEYYTSVFDYEKAIPALFELLKYCPPSDNMWAFNYLYKCFLSTGKVDQLKQLFEYAIIKMPNNFWGYENLGSYLLEKKDFITAEKVFLKEISVDPTGGWMPYIGLAHCYLHAGDVSSAINILEMGINSNPNESIFYDMLTKIFVDNNQIPKAELVLERSLGLVSNNPDSLNALSIKTNEKMYDCQMLLKLYNLDHKPDLAAILNLKVEQYEGLRSNAYKKIFKMLDDKNIPLIAVQYPMKSVDTLKESLPFRSSMLYFVDNEASFKRGVAESGFFDYFVNQEFNDLGHLSPKGCLLLANNVSETILRVVKSNH